MILIDQAGVEVPDGGAPAFVHHNIDSGYSFEDFDVNDRCWAWHQDGLAVGNPWFVAQVRSKNATTGRITVRFADCDYNTPGYHPSELSLEDENENEDHDMLLVNND